MCYSKSIPAYAETQNLYQRGNLVLMRDEILKAMARERQCQGGIEKVPLTSAEPIKRDGETNYKLAREAKTSHDAIHKESHIAKGQA